MKSKFLYSRSLLICLLISGLVACGETTDTANNSTENNSTENNSTENNSTENNSTENNNTENNSTENNSTENNSTENNSTENNSTENNSAENNSTENNSAENNSTENNSTENNSTENNSTENNSTENNNTGPQAPDISGTWAQKVVMSSISTLPIVGDITTETIGIQHVVLDRNSFDGTYTVTSTPCDLYMESDNGLVETVIPQAFVDSMEITSRQATLVENGNGYTYTQEKMYMTAGVTLTNIETDALPDDASDSRVFDQDNDENPGVTVEVSGLASGEIYLIQRTWDELEGIITTAGNLDGLVSWDQEQVVLDASNALLTNQPDTQVDPTAENSYFQTVPVDDTADCGFITTNSDSLFNY